MRRRKVYKLLLCILCSVCSTSAFANGSEIDWEPVMQAIIQVESNGRHDAKNGHQVGCMQITPILVADCNEFLKSRKSKKRYTLSDRYSIEKSKEMFVLIQKRYNPTNNIEKAIRLWNGGCNYSIKKTQRYFEKVMRILRK